MEPPGGQAAGHDSAPDTHGGCAKIELVDGLTVIRCDPASEVMSDKLELERIVAIPARRAGRETIRADAREERAPGV